VKLLLNHGLTAAFALKRLRSATNGHYRAPLADRLSGLKNSPDLANIASMVNGIFTSQSEANFAIIKNQYK
jgi:hypothetical protein